MEFSCPDCFAACRFQSVFCYANQALGLTHMSLDQVWNIGLCVLGEISDLYGSISKQMRKLLSFLGNVYILT